MDASKDINKFYRPGRRIWKRWAVLVVLVVVAISWRRSPRDADPSMVETGEYQVARINGTGSLRIVVPHATRREVDVDWLGIEITDASEAIACIGDHLQPGDKIRVRLDRRRLNDSGTLVAYLYHEDQFLNAELIRRGCAIEDTHPSDFAPIARRLRQAKSQEVANN